MAKKTKKNKILLGPIFTILILTALVMVISILFDLLGIEGQTTAIVNGTLETSLTTVRNIVSMDGLKYLLTSAVDNLALFRPLLLLIVALIGIGIGEKSGLFKAMFKPFHKLKSFILTLIVLFLGIISSFLGEYCFVLIIPFCGAFYRAIGKNPIQGILTAFIGMTIGYGTGIFYNADMMTLGRLTEEAASLEVDKNYVYHSLSNLWIMITSTVLLTAIGTFVIEHFLAPKLHRNVIPEETDEIVISKKASFFTLIVFLLCIGMVGYAIIPGMSMSGFLLDHESNNYVVSLLGDNAPFHQSLVYLVTIIIMICGLVYGFVSGNVKNSHDYSLGLSKGFEHLGYVFVLLFFTAQMGAILEWTNVGTVLAGRLIDFMGMSEFSGIPLIVTFIFVVIILGIFVPGTVNKWMLLSPVIVPLFMGSNITPDFTQFIFQVADGIGKSMTPFFAYFIIMLAFLEKYNYNSETKITVFGTIRRMLPSVLILTGVWILIILGWFMIGLPIGIGTYPTL